MQIVVDRFEGDIAVCEKSDRTMLNIPRAKLPPETREGDVLEIDGETISLNTSETAQRKSRIEQKMQKLRRQS